LEQAPDLLEKIRIWVWFGSESSRCGRLLRWGHELVGVFVAGIFAAGIFAAGIDEEVFHLGLPEGVDGFVAHFGLS
jgi:hypothetical protein